MRDVRRATGFTLIEATVVLSVLAILTMVLVPTITNYISEARRTQAQEEVNQLGKAILAFYNDAGFFPKTVDSVNGRLGNQAVDMLVSAGSIPKAPAGTVLDRQGRPVVADVSGWLTGSFDLLDNHLLRNNPGYRNKGGPNEFGWNGAYLNSSEIQSDPWGNRYMVNVRFLDPSPGVLDAAGQVKLAVLALSAGPNGVVETPFFQPKTNENVYGDDIAFIIQ